jgi:hypothetical protein
MREKTTSGRGEGGRGSVAEFEISEFLLTDTTHRFSNSDDLVSESIIAEYSFFRFEVEIVKE